MNSKATNQPGVYSILNLENGKHYIGSTKHLSKRFKEHIYDLGSGRHSSRILQNAWNKYGHEAFRFDVIEVVEGGKEALLEREQFWMDQTLPYYNVAKKAESRAGIRATEETKRRISEAKFNQSDETREKIGRASKAMWEDREMRERLIEAAKGRSPVSEETRAKLSAAGRSHTEEAKRKQGVAWLGRAHTDESLAKMREAQSGKFISEEQREKLRQANLGKTHSEETKRKMREAHARRRAEKSAQSQSAEREVQEC